jgi:hypothetical protein
MTMSRAALTPIARIACAAIAAWTLSASVDGQRPRFYPDDPLAREPETQDASKAEPWEIPLTPDLVSNLFGQPGDPVTGQKARNVNTADEVPDSSWFTNRIHARPLTVQEITTGPNTMAGPAPGKLTIIRPKSAGVSPGFTARDEKGEVWFVTFDAKRNPVASTATVMIATKLFWALGYNQVETYLTTIRPENIVIDEGATLRAHGKRRRFTDADLADVLGRSAKSPDGSYRAIAGRALPGKILGPFRYFGTRPDDPNDIVPHEHRRELRALQVFGAWTNLVDMKAGNTLDTLVMEGGRGSVRHYLQDVGSTFGTGALAHREGDEGYEYIYDGAPTWRRFFTFGLYISPWQTVDYDEHPEVGRFEGEQFEPEKWKPRVPVAALRHARADDTFWAAQRVMAFTDEQIRAAVKVGAYTDPAAEKLLGDVLIQRRDKIGRAYYTGINPLTEFALDGSGTLTFRNAAVAATFAPEPKGGYEAQWSRFDNATGASEPLGAAVKSTAERMSSPQSLPTAGGAFVKVSIRAIDPPHPSWNAPVDIYFRRSGNEWRLVGVERLPDATAPAGRTTQK